MVPSEVIFEILGGQQHHIGTFVHGNQRLDIFLVLLWDLLDLPLLDVPVLIHERAGRIGFPLILSASGKERREVTQFQVHILFKQHLAVFRTYLQSLASHFHGDELAILSAACLLLRIHLAELFKSFLLGIVPGIRDDDVMPRGKGILQKRVDVIRSCITTYNPLTHTVEEYIGGIDVIVIVRIAAV